MKNECVGGIDAGGLDKYGILGVDLKKSEEPIEDKDEERSAGKRSYCDDMITLHG